MLKTGTQAPLFQLADDEGRETSLQHHLAGGPVVVAFFKISCPTCQFAFPYLNRLFQEGGVPVLGVSQNDALATRGFRSPYGLFVSDLAGFGRGWLSGKQRLPDHPCSFAVSDRAGPKHLDQRGRILANGLRSDCPSFWRSGVSGGRADPRIQTRVRIEELAPRRGVEQ